MYAGFVKRFFDITLSLLALIVLLPLWLLLCFAIKANSRGPVLFKQKRVGKNKSYFNILKFRTMYENTPKDVPTHLLQGAQAHITKLGHFLRKTSLDELPQLINILLGQMSIVGPRPALWNQQDLVEERDKYGANNILPGLTGYAQVSGRDELPIKIKAQRDGYYAQNLCFWLDVKIFFKTISNVFTAKGVVEGAQQK